MAIFNATKQNISLHINNIYDEGELEQIATVWYKKKNREISWKLKKLLIFAPSIRTNNI